MKVWPVWLLLIRVLFAVCEGARLRSRSGVHSPISGHPVQERQSLLSAETSPKHAIAIEFFVMSKCPDAKICEQTFLPVLEDLAQLVTVNFTYIADSSKTQENGEQPAVQCMHGPAECVGDQQRLCAQTVLTSRSGTDLRFALCQDAGTVPENGKACAKSAGFEAVELQAWDACLSGTLGEELLRASAERAESLSITTSCTLHVESQAFCVHDGQWKDCGSACTDKADCLKAKVCELSRHPRKSEFCQ